MNLRACAAGTALALGLALGGCSNWNTDFLNNVNPANVDLSVNTSGFTEPYEVTSALTVGPPPALIDSTPEECTVLAAALDAVAKDWRTNPKEHILRVNVYAISADRIDRDYREQASGVLPPSKVSAIHVGLCGTVLASTSARLRFYLPEYAVPDGDRATCKKELAGWISRAGIDADRMQASVIYTSDACHGTYWLVRLFKDYRGIWTASPPDPL